MMARVAMQTPIDEAGVAALFERWNAALESGDPEVVVALYAPDSVLLPTMADGPLHAAADKVAYFRTFLANQPTGRVTTRHTVIGDGWFVDSGMLTFHFAATQADIRVRYTFVYALQRGEWRIITHHSSLVPSAAPR